MTNGNDGAFARVMSDFLGGSQLVGGMTKREMFAAMAMQGLVGVALEHTRPDQFVDTPQLAVMCADRLIAALNETTVADGGKSAETSGSEGDK